MNASLRRILLVIFLQCAFGGAARADTNSVASSQPPEVVNGILQIQQQLHDTQLAIEHNRQQSEADARHSADDLNARLAGLQQLVAAQRQKEIDAAQRTQQLILMLGGTLGAIGLAALLSMTYLQWRAVTRLVEMISVHPAELVMEPGRVAPSLVANAAVEQSNARLFSMVDQMEKRILDLKQVTQAPLAAPANPAPAPVPAANGHPQTQDDRDECVANLISEGQSLLATEPQKALECFDVALGLHPKHPEALVKRGGALEKLGRLDEAIACYDQAIEADSGMTIAYLHKGGLYNRLSRYDEALQCYERALQTQEKKPDEKAVV